MARDPARAGDRRVLRLRLADEHRFRQRRLLVGLARFVADEYDFGRRILRACRQRRTDAGRPAADDHDPAGVGHARSAASISSMYSSLLAMTSIEA